MSEVKQVKVDNWGIFFLQRLKHFFNRTDYCDLTLQFQDNAQLKVHRLVLSACTEYFELLERTCEMYEDCLVMPDDLQADVVVPIINFMYTGQLEFRMDLLERLYQTSLVMNMPVLTKLLDAHRNQQIHREPSHLYSNYPNAKRYTKSFDKHMSPASSSSTLNSKRSYGKAFQHEIDFRKYKKQILDKPDFEINNKNDFASSTMLFDYHAPKKRIMSDPRPTRYELPEELETDHLFDNSFTNISYTSKPLMVHPETTKRYPPKRTGIFEDPSTSKRFIHGQSTMDIVECKKISVSDRMFEDDPSENICDNQETFSQPMSIKAEPRDSNQLFDQILDGGPKVTIETKDKKLANNLDHAKIISEVLKKFPQLVKSNKNIKLKILNTPSKKKPRPANSLEEEKEIKQKNKAPTAVDYAYESKVLDSKEAAKLIALGAENINGPWICLICGAPGKAIHFSSYYKFRRHLVEVHNEKPVLNLCEYCGQKAMKRNYLLHHLYTKHGIEPPSHYRFPKCDICNYVALNEGYLLKHKLTHPEKLNFRCNVCSVPFCTSNQLLVHIQKTGHKYSADKKANLQCIYCFRSFSREGELYAHLRTNHKEAANSDGIIEISDFERPEIKENKVITKSPPKHEVMKYEVPVTFQQEYQFDADVQYQIQQQPDGNIQVVSKKPRVLLPTVKHKILNPGFGTPVNKIVQKSPTASSTAIKHNEYTQNTNDAINNSLEEVVMIDNDEYVVRDNQLIPKKEKTMACEDYSLTNIIHTNIEDSVSVHNIIPTSVEFANLKTTNLEHDKMIVNKPTGINQPIQIVVSNEEEYKALMASNPSIIFEDGDANKTLTVLTTPHDNHSVDLDNAQPNDMMIIPENYPLNVSESVSGNNSNIVVVYGHPVDDQNKQYQLLAPENLEAQFVASTAILTQNYETVTTSAAVINAHGLHTPVGESWSSNNIPQSIPCSTELEIPGSNNQISGTPVETQPETIGNIEEVQLPPMTSDDVEMPPSADVNQTDVEINNQSFNVNNINETSPVVNNIHRDGVSSNDIGFVETVEPNFNADDRNEASNVKENSDQPIEELNDVIGSVPQEDIRLENISVNEVEETSCKQEALDETKFTENVNSEESSESETIQNIAKAIQCASLSVVNPIPVETDIPKPIVGVECTNIEVTSIKAKEQIQNLTSEWSDDELDTLTQEQSTPQEDDDKKEVTKYEPMETDSQSELEESIENIQHEMEKQLTRLEPLSTVQKSEEPICETVNVAEVLQQDAMLEQQTVPENDIATLNENKTPVKLSSLLNDWEDNDSEEVEGDIKTKDASNNHEDGESDKKIAEYTESSVVKVESVNDAEELLKEPEPTTGENIQSLVNDWVEDEEDDATEQVKSTEC